MLVVTRLLFTVISTSTTQLLIMSRPSLPLVFDWLKWHFRTLPVLKVVCTSLPGPPWWLKCISETQRGSAWEILSCVVTPGDRRWTHGESVLDKRISRPFLSVQELEAKVITRQLQYMDWSTQTVMAATVLHLSTFRLSDDTYCHQTWVLSPSALVYNHILSACHVREIMFQAITILKSLKTCTLLDCSKGCIWREVLWMVLSVSRVPPITQEIAS